MGQSYCASTSLQLTGPKQVHPGGRQQAGQPPYPRVNLTHGLGTWLQRVGLSPTAL